jgi:AmmeMemoRadiSam system protein B
MNVRKRYLPTGWYPQDQASTAAKIQTLALDAPPKKYDAKAAIVPHAGWEFSGKAAVSVFNSIKKIPETVVVVGGHLHAISGIYAAYEEAYETPLGAIPADEGLLNELKNKLHLKEDTIPDNTVEIQLPFIKHYFPEAKVLWMRAAPSEQAFLLGKTLWELAGSLPRNILVLGSTDLTHYGLNYGFVPKGLGVNAVQWVKQENDKHIIDALIGMDLQKALNFALTEHSACSAGGAVAAAQFARSAGINKGKLLSYYTSWDIYPSDSFVGYAGILYTE